VRTGFGIFNRAGSNISYGRARAVPDLIGKVSSLNTELAGTLQHILEQEYFWDEVADIRDREPARTYDFTVPDIHAFVANGIVSHNSGGKTRRAAKMIILNADHPDILDFVDSKANEEMKAWALIEAGYDGSYTGEAYGSVFFQNANHSVRVTDEYMRAVEEDGDWTTYEITTGQPVETMKARAIFRRMSEAAWICGDPGIQYDSTIQDWHTVPNHGRISASNPCSEYVHIDDSACNLASLNLMRFVNDHGEFDAEAFRYACRITITAQEILVDNASYPTPKIEENSHRFRPLGMGYANLGALLMSRGLAYDSDAGRAYASALTAIMTGEGFRQSAITARDHGGPFNDYSTNEQPFLRVIRKHRDAAHQIPESQVPSDLMDTARATWDEAVALGDQHGFRNSQISVLAPTGTISFLLDCDTTGVEPDIALIKYKKLVGEGFLKIVNNTVPIALRKLGYTADQVEEIVKYIDERETIEGAPGLKPEHLPVFDCAFKPVNGERSIHYMGHVRMMGAVQPFLSGAISKTVNMPEAATPEDIEDVYLQGWKLGLKAIAIYRDGSKRSQPLSTGKKKDDGAVAEEAAAVATAPASEPKPYRRRLPDERAALTHKFQVAGHEGYITVGLYPDGQPGEIFLKMAKEGSTVSGLMDSLATMTSLSLQYGVPLHDLVNKFAHVRFEPAGFTGNSEIPIAKSIVDYVFRWLGARFLPQDDREALGIIGAGASSPISMAPVIDASASSTTTTDTQSAGASGAFTSSAAPPPPPPSSSEGESGERPTAVGTASSGGSDAVLPVLSNGHSNGHSNGSAKGNAVVASLGATTRVSFSVSADSPSCAECGSIMVRNGSCYKCLNCGSTSGCS
jgi:ribonucleoside-diphosphate reductase alpha chain